MQAVQVHLRSLTPTTSGIRRRVAPAHGWVVLIFFVTVASGACSPPFSEAPGQVEKSGTCGSIELASPLEVRRRKDTRPSREDSDALVRISASLRRVPSARSTIRLGAI